MRGSRRSSTGSAMSSTHDRYLAELPRDWPRKELGQICSQIVSGGTPSRSNSSYWGGSVPWVTPGELTHLRAKYLSSTDERITDLGLASSGATLVPSDSLLVTTRATLGSVALAAMPLATNQGFKTAVFGPDVDPSFGYHLFHRLKPELTRRASGTTFLEISGSQFEQVVVPVPPMPEQRRIAEILDAVDDAVRSTERVVAKLELMKQGLVYDLLTRGIDEDGGLRDPVRSPRQFAETALGLLPREWSIARCGDLCREIVVGIVIRPTQWYASAGVPVLRSANVREDGIDMSDLMFMTASSHRALAKSAVSPGDVVTVRTGYPGTTAVIPPSVAEANCVDIIISRAGPLLLPHYLSTWVNAPIGKEQVLAKQGGLAQQHFNVGEMKELLVALPRLGEQAAICARADAIQKQIVAERKLIHKLALLKDGLTTDLLTGRVRVSVVDEETA